jgi:hypothetical protein
LASTAKVHRARSMQQIQVHSLAQLLWLAAKVDLTAPQDLPPLDQSPISSVSFLSKFSIQYVIASLTRCWAPTRRLLYIEGRALCSGRTLMRE